MALIGKIIAMTGVATIQNEKGDKRPLHPGDQIQTGDSIQTTAGVDVDVQLANGRVIHIGSDQMVAFTPELAEVFAPTQADSAVNVATIDTVIQAIQDGRDINEVLEETAAGGVGGSDGSHSAVYLERINQTLNTLSFEGDAGGVENILLTNALAFTIPFIGTITSDTEPESTALVHTVTVQSANNSDQSFDFSIIGSGTNPATVAVGGDITSFTFSNGVVFTPSANDPFVGTISVPAGVENFTVTVNTLDDSVFEGNETYTINIGDQSATGTITDDANQPTVVSVEVGAPGISDDTVPEGTPLVYNVTLSGSATVPLNYPFVLGGGSASANDFDGNNLVFSNGVTLSNGVITVPAGVTTFSVTVPTTPNDVFEGTESVPLTIGGVQGTGFINDDADKPIVEKVEKGNTIDPDFAAGGDLAGSQVLEGDTTEPLAFTVTLNKTSTTPTTVNLTLSAGDVKLDGSDTPADPNADIVRQITIVFDNGVSRTVDLIINNNTFSVDVPAGVKSFSVSMPTVDDSVYEGIEALKLTAGTVDQVTPPSAESQIVDDEIAPIISVASGDPGEISAFGGEDFAGGGLAGLIVTEGDPSEPLLFTVALDKASKFDTDVNLTLAGFGGSPAAITGNTADIVRNTIEVVFANGAKQTVELVGDAFNVTIPAGQTTFVVVIPTNPDSIIEATESLSLTAQIEGSTGSAIGQIVDDDSTIPVVATGLRGEYFGYNDTVVAGNRVHERDTLSGNLDSIQDVENIINFRNGSTVVGTAEATKVDVADVAFKATNIRYGLGNDNSLTVTNNLGSNVAQGEGETLSQSSALARFLNEDAVDAKVQSGSATATSSGVGQTTDSVIRLTGSVFLERGNYDFRVFADDGFRLKVGGETLVEFDGNQSPTTREYKNLNISGGQSGLTPIELIYWEQGQNGVLRIEYKLSSEGADGYKTFSLDNLLMLEDATPAFTLKDTQDVVKNGVDVNGNPIWVIRTGQELTVANANNQGQIIGGDANDVITGGSANETLRGGAGADNLFGGVGNDILEGGAGNDKLDGGTGNDRMFGGTGDDIYVVDTIGDIVSEEPGEGTDTIELAESYEISTYEIKENIENVLVKGSLDVNVNGNELNNRIVGGAGDNTINGDAGDDRIIGGAGNDTLTGGTGNDVFEWNLADRGSVGTPAEDTITDFKFTGNGLVDPNPNNSSAISRTDAIDLRDLLQGSQSGLTDANYGPIEIGNLLKFVNFSVEGGSTVINVSSAGGFVGDGTLSSAVVDQKIVLQNVNLYTDTNTDINLVNHQTLLLQKILANGTLIVD